jgi:hypothetical protein
MLDRMQQQIDNPRQIDNPSVQPLGLQHTKNMAAGVSLTASIDTKVIRANASASNSETEV